MENLILGAEMALERKTFSDGLTSHTQANCQVTLTDDGYRIYRPPNLTTSANGNTMWGGLVLRNAYPQKDNHTYILKFEIKGKTSQNTETYWTNNCGWGGGSYGLPTDYTGVTYYPNNFTNWQSDEYIPFFFKWTTGTVWRTCTTSYSNFVAGQSYDTYRDFKFGWNYGSTGAMGTDVYIKNLRMYDITNGYQEVQFLKTGIVKTNALQEYTSSTMARIWRDGEIESPSFYEI